MMVKSLEIHIFEDLEYKIKYSKRRTIGISVLPDSSVIVRVPYLTSFRTINSVVEEKYGWILKHRDNYRSRRNCTPVKSYTSGEIHFFHGKESVLKIERSGRHYFRFYDGTIYIGVSDTENVRAIRRLLYKGYKTEALKHFPEIMKKVLADNPDQMFNPSRLVVRTMKRRWGSCSNKGVITLSTELIKLSDLFIEYVIIHELCHLRHHNHGAKYYRLLSEVFPQWKSVRKELRKKVQ